MKEKNRTAAQVFRRLPALLLAAMFMMMSAATGENALRSYTKEDGYVYLRLGQYPQTADGGVEPILWRVLTVDDEKAYLLSEYILFARAMHTSRKEYEKFGGDFAQTELCQYLNTTFAEEAFTEADLSMLLECEDFGKVFLVTRGFHKSEEDRDKSRRPRMGDRVGDQKQRLSGERVSGSQGEDPQCDGYGEHHCRRETPLRLHGQVRCLQPLVGTVSSQVPRGSGGLHQGRRPDRTH